jgi:hypothetical protein
MRNFTTFARNGVETCPPSAWSLEDLGDMELTHRRCGRSFDLIERSQSCREVRAPSAKVAWETEMP